MKKILLALVAASAMAMAGNFYGGASTSATQSFLDGDRHWFNTGLGNSTDYGLGAQVGYTIVNAGIDVASEVRYTRTFGETDSDTYSFLVKPGMNIVGIVDAYVLGGYSVVDFNDDTVDGFTYGAGASKAITDKYSIFADYTVLPESFANQEMVTVGINYNF